MKPRFLRFWYLRSSHKTPIIHISSIGFMPFCAKYPSALHITVTKPRVGRLCEKCANTWRRLKKMERAECYSV